MSEEPAFLIAIRSDPNNDTLRLVYADWLDEHDRLGGEYLRLDCELAHTEVDDDNRWLVHRRRYLAVRGFDPDWVRSIDRESLTDRLLRFAGIREMLTKRVTVGEMESASIAAWGEAQEVTSWLNSNLQSDDELWEYKSSVEGGPWGHQMGCAIIREGNVVNEFAIWTMDI